MNSLKSLLKQDRVLVGVTTQHVTTAWLAKLWKNSAADFVYVEYEHSFMNEADLANFVLSCRLNGLPVVAKTPELSRTHVAKLLECGVIGIQLPWTESRANRSARKLRQIPATRHSCRRAGHGKLRLQSSNHRPRTH